MHAKCKQIALTWCIMQDKHTQTHSFSGKLRYTECSQKSTSERSFTKIRSWKTSISLYWGWRPICCFKPSQ